MTRALEAAFAEAAKLPEDEQESLAAWIMAELESERRWQAAFARSADVLDKLAEEGLAERRAGKTQPLDPDAL